LEREDLEEDIPSSALFEHSDIPMICIATMPGFLIQLYVDPGLLSIYYVQNKDLKDFLFPHAKGFDLDTCYDQFRVFPYRSVSYFSKRLEGADAFKRFGSLFSYNGVLTKVSKDLARRFEWNNISEVVPIDYVNVVDMDGFEILSFRNNKENYVEFVMPSTPVFVIWKEASEMLYCIVHPFNSIDIPVCGLLMAGGYIQPKRNAGQRLKRFFNIMRLLAESSSTGLIADVFRRSLGLDYPKLSRFRSFFKPLGNTLWHTYGPFVSKASFITVYQEHIEKSYTIIVPYDDIKIFYPQGVVTMDPMTYVKSFYFKFVTSTIPVLGTVSFGFDYNIETTVVVKHYLGRVKFMIGKVPVHQKQFRYGDFGPKEDIAHQSVNKLLGNFKPIISVEPIGADLEFQPESLDHVVKLMRSKGVSTLSLPYGDSLFSVLGAPFQSDISVVFGLVDTSSNWMPFVVIVETGGDGWPFFSLQASPYATEHLKTIIIGMGAAERLILDS